MMFICEVSKLVAEAGVRPVMVVVERYGPNDFTTKTRYHKNERTGARESIEVKIPLDGQIKKEVRVLPETAKALTPCPHVRSIHFATSKQNRNESLYEPKKPKHSNKPKRNRTRRDDDESDF